MFDPSASDTLQMDRRYTICANTTIQIGEPLEPGGVAYQNGDFPLFVFHPNFSVKCGESGSSINNCVLSGGADMLQTLRDNETLASVLPVLPQLVPGLPAYPTELPTGWMPSADNLRIEGLTFQGGKDLNDGFAHADVIFTGPGSNTTLTDCIFQNSDPSSPPSAGIMSLYYEEFHSDPDAGPYIDLTISECIFRVRSLCRMCVGGPPFVSTLSTCLTIHFILSCRTTTTSQRQSGQLSVLAPRIL